MDIIDAYLHLFIKIPCDHRTLVSRNGIYNSSGMEILISSIIQVKPENSLQIRDPSSFRTFKEMVINFICSG